jgi:endonuclease/exonuclease/phosphatase family metal-dependent hydrolase
MNIKNETEEQYKRRCYKIKHKIFDIISKNPDIDILLLQELPSNLRGDIFHKNMRLEIGKNVYILLCNYDTASWPNGIMYNSTKYKAKQIFPPEGSSNEEYNRIGIFVLTEHGKKNTIVYVSVHFSFKKAPNRDQELVKLMDDLVINLIRTLPHNISEIVFGGDFNTGFKTGLFSEFKDVRLYTLPQYEVYSTHDNFGRRNEQNVDYIIVYKLF